jgi:lipoprotein-anchoring transpeptidase ErfK/SrfK
MLRGLFIGAAFAVSLAVLPFSAHSAERSFDTLTLQVALDRAGFSPGILDGKMGLLTRQAVQGFQEANRLEVTGRLDAATREVLGAEVDATETVEVTEADEAGPFLASIPDSMAEKAKLPGLYYTSIEEALAEKYHTTPATLRALNRDTAFESGSQIRVPAVRPGGMAGGDANGWDAMLAKLSVAKIQANAARVVVDKSEQLVRAFDADGNVLAQFPATLGSEHDPLPLGQWKVLGVSKLPSFNYNPDLFWDADASDTNAKLPPGPNGPVGVVWIGFSKEHYGIHGTPEPESIGRTQSHGCIRLTNWDAAKLAQMVRAGTPVILQE